MFSEKARLRRMRRSNGVPHWRGYRIFCWPIYAFSKIFATVRVEGLEDLNFYPRRYKRWGRSIIDGMACIFLPTHGSTLDISSIQGPLRRPVTIVGKAFFAMCLPLTQLFFIMGLVSIERRKDSHSKLPGFLGTFMIKWRQAVTYRTDEMMEVLEKSLARGIPAVMFPTGSRTSKKTRYGAFRVSFRTGAPIVPVAIVGCKKGDAVRVGLLRRRLVTVVYGEPIYPPYKKDGEIDPADLEALLNAWEEATEGPLKERAEQLRWEWWLEYVGLG